MKNEYDYLNDVKMDFSLYSEKTISEEEVRSMAKMTGNNKKIKVTKKKYLIAACAAAIAVTCTAMASEGYFDRVIKIISTGYNSYYQMDASAPHELPEGLKGKLFDKNGVALECFKEEDYGNIYDAEGNIIDNKKLAEMYEEVLGGQVKVSDDYDPEESEKSYSTIKEAQEEAVFDIKVPEYVPEGYTLSRAYTYKGDDGSVSGQYITLEYINDEGKEMLVFERILNDETAVESGTDGTIEETEINGRKAVIQDGDFIGWETEDNVSVDIATRGNITREEMLKMAESVK